MEIKERDDTFEIILNISDQNVDPKVKDRLRSFLGKSNEEVKDKLVGLIDDIVYCAWTNGLVIEVLRFIRQELGITDDECRKIHKEADESRNNPLVRDELKAKYGWEAGQI